MAPQRKVINQGAVNTQRDSRPESGTPGWVRVQIEPSESILTSRLRLDDGRARASAQAEAAVDTTAALQTRTGWRGSPTSAATASTPADAAVAATAASQSRRSRADGCRTVQPRITQCRLKTRVPFVPPKPNEFLSATSIFIARAELAQ